jgi:hypothetical protein
MGPHSLAPTVALALAFERAQLRLLLGEQLFNHRPLALVGFRGEQPSVIEPSYVLR